MAAAQASSPPTRVTRTKRLVRDVEGLEPTPAGTQHHVRTGCIIGAVCFLAYLTSLQPSRVQDTIPTRLLPFSILRELNSDLNEFAWLIPPTGIPYFLNQTRKGTLFSRYPMATSLAAIPVAALALAWLDWHGVSDHDVRFRLAAIVTERLTAALIAATSVVLLYLALITISSKPVAIATAFVYGLGSHTWSTSSQALYQHGLVELSLAGLSLCLVAANTQRNALAAGGFAALGVLARPTMLPFALVATAYVWKRRSQRLLAFLVLPVISAGLLLFYNMRTFEAVHGGYSGGGGVRFLAPNAASVLGLLISPNRGLFVYIPVVLLAVPGLAWWRPQRQEWLRYLAFGIWIYLLFYSSFRGWWAGHTYGPRFLIDTLPALALCAVPAVEWLKRWRAGVAAMGSLVAVSVGVQAIGVYCDHDHWNHLPRSIDDDLQRAWDWKDSQILRALRRGWHGAPLAPLLYQAMTDPRPALLQEMNPGDLVGEIELEEERPLRFKAGEFARLAVTVRNRSAVVWPAFSDYGFLDCRLVCIWVAKGQPELNYASSLALPRNVGPGEAVRVEGLIDVPNKPRTYELKLMLVQALDASSGIHGGIGLNVPVVVESSDDR